MKRSWPRARFRVTRVRNHARQEHRTNDVRRHLPLAKLYLDVSSLDTPNDMIEFTEEQIAARELRNAAYHEAAHKIVYERFGGAGDAVVWRNESVNPEEVAWLGQFRPRTCPEEMRTIALASGFSAPELPVNWKVLVGIAGLVAEEILRDDTDDVDVIADALLIKISDGEASASDLAMMGITDSDSCELSYEVVEEVAWILREGWRVLQQEADYLIEFATD